MTTQARELAKLVNNSGDVNLGDDITLGSDGALLNFGADSDVVITHVADTGLLLNSTRQLQFGDSGTYIHQSADGVLDLVSDTEIELNATTLDINANVDISGTLTVAGALDFGDAVLSNVGAVALDSISGDADANTSITFSGSDVITITTGGETQVTFNNGSILPTTDNDIDLGSSSLQFKDAHFHGTVETDALTIGGTTLAETIADTVGAMVSSNTETNISVSYDDSDNTLDFVVGTVGTANESGLATNVTTTANNSADETVFPTFVDGATGSQGIETDTGFTYNPSSGMLTATGFTGAVTGNVTGSAATVTGAAQTNITSVGTLTSLTVDDITINGSTISDASDLTIDVGGDLILDAADNDIIIKQNGTSYAQLTRSGNDFRIFNLISDGDLVFRGNDGGVNFTALTLDMSDAGTATFNHDIKLPDGAYVKLGAGSDLSLNSDGTNGTIFADNGNLTLDVEGDIILDANGGDIKFKDDGTEIGSISMSGSNLNIISAVSDEDIFFKGNDGGSSIDALTLDMSEAGAATFNGTVTLPSNIIHTGDTDTIIGFDTNTINYTTGNQVGMSMVNGVNFMKSASPTDPSGSAEQSYIYHDNASNTSLHIGAQYQNAAAAIHLETYLTPRLSVFGSGDISVAKSARVAQVAITSSSNAVAWDAKAAQNAYHVTTENTTFSAPSNAVEGAVVQVELAQGGTARTIAWNTVFEFAASTAPTVTATANKTDIFTFRYNGSVWQEIGRVQNMAQT